MLWLLKQHKLPDPAREKNSVTNLIVMIIELVKAMICTFSYKFNSWKQTDTLNYENLISACIFSALFSMQLVLNWWGEHHGKKIWLSMHLSNHTTRKPMWIVAFLARMEACNLCLTWWYWQQSNHGIRWPESHDRIATQVPTYWGHMYFFLGFPLTGYYLLIDHRLKFMFVS